MAITEENVQQLRKKYGTSGQADQGEGGDIDFFSSGSAGNRASYEDEETRRNLEAVKRSRQVGYGSAYAGDEEEDDGTDFVPGLDHGGSAQRRKAAATDNDDEEESTCVVQ